MPNISTTPIEPAIDLGADLLHVVYMDPDISMIAVERMLNTLDVLDRLIVTSFAYAINRQVARAENINDVLEQGERLDRVENMSGNLAMESKKYAKKAKDLSRQALIQKYMPVIVLVGLFICVYGFRRFFAAA